MESDGRERRPDGRVRNVAIHLHIGSNIPGFLPENDTYCVDNADDAAACARSELLNLGEFVSDGCDADGCRVCSWCRRGRTILRRWRDLADSPDAFGQLVADGWTETFAVPCSPGHAVWVQVVDTPRDTCEDNADKQR